MRDAFRAWATTHRGLVRRHNEDSCLTGEWRSRPEDSAWRGFVPGDNRWAAVADGMGGHRSGDTASSLVIDCFRAQASSIVTEADVHRVLARTNARIFEAMSEPEGSPAMGSTIVAFVAVGDEALIFNVGDSRAYLLSADRLHRVSLDHTPGRSSSAGRSHALTQSLGGTLTPRPLVPHVTRCDLRSVDAVLLCSDGLTDMVDDDEIESLLVRRRDDPAEALLAAALDAGGSDNVTIIVISR